MKKMYSRALVGFEIENSDKFRFEFSGKDFGIKKKITLGMMRIIGHGSYRRIDALVKFPYFSEAFAFYNGSDEYVPSQHNHFFTFVSPNIWGTTKMSMECNFKKVRVTLISE